jgi:5-methyltetrahydrofolate--homocysteine methyltransferase
MDIQTRFKKQGFLLADGATGTELIRKKVLKKGLSPEHLLLSSINTFIDIHESYYNAGSDYVVANTFGASRTKLKEWNLEDKIQKINENAINAVKTALKRSKKKAFVAASIGPTGLMFPPFGNAFLKDVIGVYKEQINIILKAGGVDLFVLETISDLREAKAFYIALRDLTDIPCGISFTFDETSRTLAGNSPELIAATFDSTDVLFIGANCSVGPSKISNFISLMGEYTSKAILVKPNAGVKGKVYSEQDFLNEINFWVSYGARVFGGCCGTTPNYILKIREKLEGIEIKKKIEEKKGTFLSSSSNIVSAGKGFAPLIIGERINPTNKKDMIEEIKLAKTTLIEKIAKEEEKQGANLLDINVGTYSNNKKEYVEKLIEKLQSYIKIPLVIDSTDLSVLEQALRSYGGKLLINSTTCETGSLNKVFKLAKRYGAAVICLTMDEKGIPKKACDRVKFIDKILKYAKKYKIKKEDILIDTLTLSLSSNQNDVMETVKAMKMVKEKYGLTTVLGVSNVSFGLPRRDILNKSFLSICLNEGLDMAIVNPSLKSIHETYDALKVLKGIDKYSMLYVKKYRSEDKKEIKKENVKSKDIINNLKISIVEGDVEEAIENAKLCLKKGFSVSDISNKALLPAMEVVGDYFKTGAYFLPQVILCADSMKSVFKKITKNELKKEESKIGTILMATVKGDIHDIGKNIVSTLLETNGFKVIDLGKSVGTYEIIKEAKKIKPDVIGLSALMTTTMSEMESVIKEIEKEKLDVPVIIGGAVITQNFANKIGAKFYANNAVEAVNILKAYLTK